MTSNFLNNACTKIQNMAFKTSEMDQIALEYWYYGFLGRLRVDGSGFLHQKPILKKRSPEQNSRCCTCAEACHSPFNLQLFAPTLIKWLPAGECADWCFDNIMTRSYCFHRRYSMPRQKDSILINEYALDCEPVPFKFMIISGCKSLLKICFENSEHSLIRFVTYNDLHNVNDIKQDSLEVFTRGCLEIR